MTNSRKRTGEANPANADKSSQAQIALGRAVALHLEGKLKEALKELDKALESNGEIPAEVFSARGHIQFELEQYEEAAQSYTKLLSLEPKHPAATFNLGVCLEKLGRWAQAAEQFQKAWEANPKRMDALLGFGVCLLHLDRPRTHSTPSSGCWR